MFQFAKEGQNSILLCFKLLTSQKNKSLGHTSNSQSNFALYVLIWVLGGKYQYAIDGGKEVGGDLIHSSVASSLTGKYAN